MTSQKCRKCGIEKEIELFSFTSKKLGKRSKQCKECVALLTSAHYKANKSKYWASTLRLREQVRSELNKIKEENPCADCGKQYPFYVMDFDHLDKTQKVANVSKLLRLHGGQAVFDEIKKCDLVCANCHRIRTFNRLDHVN